MEKAKEIDNRFIRIKLVDGTTINGQANIKKEQGYDRLSDLVGSTQEEFIILNGATLYHSDFEDQVKHPVLFVNKRHIIWTIPDENQR